MQSYKKTKRNARGFTLVEMLIVVVIIGILASLVTVAAIAGGRAARRAAIKADITQVEAALEQYKNKYGEYPPDFSDPNAVMRHVRKRWPRCNISEPVFFQNVVNAGWKVVEVDNNGDVEFDDGHVIPDEDGVGHLGAITFWLGGLPEGGMLGGFSADPSNPFNLNPNVQREKPMLELTIGGNVVNCDNPFGVYYFKSYKYPIVYFKAGYEDPQNPGHPKHFHDEDGTLGCVVPYARSGSNVANAVWHNPKSFQLIHPGLDGVYGDHDHGFRAADPDQEVRVNCTKEDDDNQANFGGTTLGS